MWINSRRTSKISAIGWMDERRWMGRSSCRWSRKKENAEREEENRRGGPIAVNS